ncbi:MAG: ribosome biogenesis GTPase Der [Bdellovibrionales bacterium]|nr:ribosome biogenesis GTPase Der [Bdellovibrionales bacterium]
MKSRLYKNRVAIIGRPNVGKSTLFNILTRTRKSVVRNEPGVTRDIIIEPAEWWGHDFEVLDTGGLTEATDIFSQLIKEQVSEILKSVDVLVVVMDGKSGLMPEDRDIIKIAKQTGLPMCLVVNKVDQAHKSDLTISEFYEFGLDIIAASFERRENVDEVIEWVIQHLPEKSTEIREGVRLTVVGKPNVGKSSLCNKLLNEKRMLVSDRAGTTVDAVESQFFYNDNPYILVDTAGLRRQSKRKDGVEFLSAHMSMKSIERSDVVLLMVDVMEGPTVQDAKLVEAVIANHKPVILVGNKIDIAKSEKEAFRQQFRQKTADIFHFFPDIPITFVSAETGSGLDNLFALIEEVWDKINIKIKTSKLNDFFFQVIRKAPAPVIGTKNVKFYYLTQTHQRPPSFIAFANYPEGVTNSYRRFLTKNIQKQFGLEGIPLRIFCMKSRHAKKGNDMTPSEFKNEFQDENLESGIKFKGAYDLNEFADD